MRCAYPAPQGLAHKRWLLVFVLGDGCFMLQRQPDAVQTVQHAVAAEVVDFKAVATYRPLSPPALPDPLQI